MIESRFQFLLLLLLALFHPLTERWLRPFGLSVDYPFLVVFWIALRKGRSPGAFYGFLVGFLRDLGNYSVLGGSALAYSLLGFAVGDMREKVNRDDLGTRLTLLTLSSLLVQAIFLLPRSAWSLADAFWAWWRYALGGSLLTTLAYAAILFLVHLLREGARLLHEPPQRV